MKVGKEANILLEIMETRLCTSFLSLLASCWSRRNSLHGKDNKGQTTEMNLCRSHSLLIVGNTSKAQSSLLISLQAKFPKLVLQLPSLSLLVLNF